MIEFLTTALWFLLAICILVPIHEYGHYFAMRRFNVKVLKFSVGFGRKIFSWTDKHGTEFALSSIPLGGYVKPLDEANGEVDDADKAFTLTSKPPWQRIIIFAAGPLANFILAAAFYWFLLAVKGTVSYSPVIGSVEPGSIAQSAGLTQGQEIVAIDGEATPSRKAVAMHLLTRLGETGPIHFVVKYPDSTLTYESEAYLDAWLRENDSPDPIGGLGLTFFYPEIPTKVGQVLPGEPADLAGFKVGDKLVSIDGVDIESWRDWVKYIMARPGQTIDVVVERAGKPIALSVTPKLIKLDSGEEIGRIGVGAEPVAFPEEMVRRYKYSVVGALGHALKETQETSAFIFLSIEKLIFGEISTKNLSGPIGIAKVAASHAERGFWAFLNFLAHLSIVLGVLNLLPIPVLDGGHIVFGLVEWIKGSPVSQEIQAWSLNVGIAMLFGVMVVAFYNDILRL